MKCKGALQWRLRAGDGGSGPQFVTFQRVELMISLKR